MAVGTASDAGRDDQGGGDGQWRKSLVAMELWVYGYWRLGFRAFSRHAADA
jgi:hypothetical protein